MKLRVVVISDTHGMHHAQPLPAGDVLIHAGDFCNHGTMLESLKFLSWFNSQPHKHKIFIAGNHDIWFEKANPSELSMYLKEYPDLVYLNDSGHQIFADDKSDSVNFWGTPVQPAFFDWAFNRKRGEEIKKHWDLIPYKTDILITHGPSFGFRDMCPDFNDRTRRKLVHVGCSDLARAIDIVKPKAHLFGHIHFGYGVEYDPKNGCYHMNASVCNEAYSPMNKPIVFDVDRGFIIPYATT